MPYHSPQSGMPRRLVAGALAWLALWPLSAGAVLLAGVVESKATGGMAATHFRNGYLMAIDEINAAGGILGEQITLREFEAAPGADGTAAAMRQAIQQRPYAILGPVSSNQTLAGLAANRESALPQFVGAEAGSLSQQFPKSLYRTSMSQRITLPRLAAFAAHALRAKRLGVVWVDNVFGREGRDTLAHAMASRGGEVVVSLGVASGQQEFSGTAEKLAKADIDALVIYTNETEAAPLLKSLRQQGFAKPILGEAPLVAERVRDEAGAAAEGVYAHLGMTPAAPNARIAAFVERYAKRFGSRPDHNGIKGYTAVAVLKAATEKLGKFDQRLLNEHMQGAVFDYNQHKGLLFSASYFVYGDLVGESYLAQVRNGTLAILGTIPISGEGVFLPSGRLVTMASRAGREALLGAGR